MMGLAHMNIATKLTRNRRTLQDIYFTYTDPPFTGVNSALRAVKIKKSLKNTLKQSIQLKLVHIIVRYVKLIQTKVTFKKIVLNVILVL